MAIVVFCPGCKTRLTLGDDRAGETFECPRCDKPISVPMLVVPPAPPPPVPRGKATPPPLPPPAPLEVAEPAPAESRGDLTDERCYDCGSRIYENELVRRDVAVGSSYVPSDGDPRHHGRFVTHHGRVSLCKSCNDARDEFNRIVGIVILCGLGLLLMWFVCGGILGRH